MRRPLSLFLPFALLLAACGEDSTAPATVDVALTLQQVPATPGEIQLEATAVNRGTVAISYPGGCVGGIRFELRDSTGGKVIVEDPCGPIIACPGWTARLDPGESLTYRFSIRGTRWETTDYSRCEGSPLEPGPYTTLAHLRFWPLGDEGSASVRDVSGSLDIFWSLPD